MKRMKTITRTIDDLIDSGEDSPLPLSVIPNYMGINLNSVEAVTWTVQNDDQLVSLTIHFDPAESVCSPMSKDRKPAQLIKLVPKNNN